MNMKKRFVVGLMVVGCAVGAQAIWVEHWQYNDPAGTQLQEAFNDGFLGSLWNWSAFGETDGNGAFIIAGDSGVKYRKLPKKGTANAAPDVDAYATPLNGTSNYTLEVDFASWTVDPASVGDKLTLKAVDSSGIMVAMVSLEVADETTVNIKLAVGNANYRSYAFPLVQTNPVSAKVVFNMAAGTASYFIDGIETNTFSELVMENIGSLVLSRTGTWGTPTTSVAIDAMGLADDGLKPDTPVFIAEKYTAKLHDPQTNTLVTFDAEAGDYVVVLGASNIGRCPTNSTIVFTNGTAALEPVVFEQNALGPAANVWYAKVTTSGSVPIEIHQADAPFWELGAYLVRATNGVLQLAQLSTAKETNAVETAISYDFGSAKSGLYIEAASAYTNVTTASTNTILDGVTDNRVVGHGFFDNVSSLTNVWTLGGSNRVAVIGIAFYSPSNDKTAAYETWISGYAVGTQTDMLDDPDGDGFDNLAEYAFGGDPSDAADTGNHPVVSRIVSAATNYFEYVYFERDDAVDRGLVSTFEVGSDLTDTNSWTSGAGYEIGRGPAAAPGYTAITNHVPATDPIRFMRVKIEFVP